MRMLVLVASLSLACTALLPRGTSPSARPERLLQSATARFAEGSLRDAIELTHEAERQARGFDDRQTALSARLARAAMYRWLAETDSTQRIIRGVIEDARRVPFPCLEAEALIIAWSLDGSAAGGTDMPPCADRVVRARLRLAAARAALASDNLEEAQRVLRRMRTLPRAVRAEIGQERDFLTAWLRSRQGRHREALALAQRVLERDRAMGTKPAIVDDLQLLARLHRAARDDSAAHAAVVRATGVLETMTPGNLVARRRALLVESLTTQVPSRR